MEPTGGMEPSTREIAKKHPDGYGMGREYGGFAISFFLEKLTGPAWRVPGIGITSKAVWKASGRCVGRNGFFRVPPHLQQIPDPNLLSTSYHQPRNRPLHFYWIFHLVNDDRLHGRALISFFQ